MLDKNLNVSLGAIRMYMITAFDEQITIICLVYEQTWGNLASDIKVLLFGMEY